jgi:hypothetical protein
MPKQYFAANGASPTTASQVPIATTAVINTMLQIATPSTTGITVIAWGFSFDGSASATPGKVELIQTDVAAGSGTSLTPSIYGCDTTPSLCVGGAALTMFNDGAITEGTITATRVFDVLFAPPTAPYAMQFPLGREPYVPPSKFLRIRVNFGTSVNCYCWVLWEE